MRYLAYNPRAFKGRRAEARIHSVSRADQPAKRASNRERGRQVPPPSSCSQAAARPWSRDLTRVESGAFKVLSGKLADWLTPEFRVVSLQCAALLGLGLLWALAGGAWRSLLLGGVVAIVPNAWFAWRIWRARQAGLPSAQARVVLWGAAEKLLLMTGLVAFVLLRIEDIVALTFFVGFTVALATHHVASAIGAGEDREA